MKSYKDMINEVLTKSTPAGEWIKDFVDSDNPKFAGKSAAKRKQMALAAYYSKQEESYAGSQNSIATTDMNEDHLVHVSDGSGYDETPHDKDIEHVKTGAMHTGGQWHGHSDKGAFFKFKSKEDAEQFKRHVDKCPHKSCYADHVNEAVEYKGIGTDVVDKKKKLNPQPNFTTDKKQVKDFKEEVEQVDESSLHRQHFQMVADLIRGHESAEKRKELAHHHAELFKKENPRFDHAKFMKAAGVNEEIQVEAKVYDPFTKKMVATNPIKVQAGGGATRNGVPVETGLSKYKSKLPMSKAAAVLAAEEVEAGKSKWHIYDTKTREVHSTYNNEKAAIKKHDELNDKHAGYTPFSSGLVHSKYGIRQEPMREEVELIDELSKGLVARYANKVAKTTQDNYDKSKDKFQFSSNRQDGMKNAVKRLTKEESEQIDEVSKSTLMRYIPKASRDVGSHTYAGKEAGEWANHYTRAGDWSAAEKHSKKSYADFKKANKRIAGIDMATKKLGTQKEEVQVDESKGLPHALVQTGKEKWHIYDTKTQKLHSTYNNKNVAMKKYAELNDKHTGYDSPGGLVKSKYGVRKEEVELDEAIAKKLPVQHAVDAVHATLGPKSATRFLSHLSPGSDKHTSWDKVNDALVKQGVQTHHIASIAQKTSHMNEEVIDESRGHKVLNTFFKNREVAQRAYQGNPAKDAEVAQGGGSPADQGIAAAKKDAEELKKKVNEVKAPTVHAAPPKKTKSTAKEYASASIPGTKRVAHAKPDDNEVGGGTATRIAEDQYTSEYKIKSFVDPVTGENKTRKIRPHRINFKASKMHGEPAQQDAPGDYGIKEGFDDYSSIAKELVKRHGKNVTAQHVKDFAGERDTHRGLDHAEIMHHVKKLSEDDKVYDEKWKKVKFTDFIKGAK